MILIGIYCIVFQMHILSLPSYAELRLPYGVRGEVESETFLINEDGSHGRRTVQRRDRFVSHQRWARGEQGVIASEGLPPSLLNATVIAPDRTEMFNPARLEAEVWTPETVEMVAVAQSASPIEFLRLLHQSADRGKAVDVTHDGALDVYTVVQRTVGTRSAGWAVSINPATRQVVKAEQWVDDVGHIQQVCEFLDWQPIEGTAWHHPTKVVTHVPGIQGGPPFVCVSTVRITGVLDADAPPEFLDFAPEVRVSDHRDKTLRDGTGKVLGDLPEPGASVNAAGTGPGWLARLPGGSSAWLVAGGAAFVVLGAVAYRLARAKHAAA